MIETIANPPNHPVARADQPGPRIAAPDVDLDAMTKDELLAHAKSVGLDVDAAMTRLELRAAIDAANRTPLVHRRSKGRLGPHLGRTHEAFASSRKRAAARVDSFESCGCPWWRLG
jgi:hypothetical protein